MNLVLRPWNFADVPELSLLADNIHIWNQVRDYFPHPYTVKHAQEWVSMQQGKKPTTNFAIQVDGRLAGGIGLLPKEDIYRCSLEIGYWIGEPYWRKGIATEAIRVLVDAVWTEYPGVVRIYAEVFSNNTGSCRALEKNGFRLESVRRNAVIKNGVIGDDMVWVCFRNGFDAGHQEQSLNPQ
jgi:RimJ/RimL family protein N-acetyltransferase